jgi:hypothetical protein
MACPEEQLWWDYSAALRKAPDKSPERFIQEN